MGLIDAHPAFRASSPQAPPQDQFLGDDYHSGGAFQLAYAFNWMSSNARARSAPTDAPAQRFDFGTPDGYRFFLDLGAAANARPFFQDEVPTWNDYMAHGTYDEYWQARNVPKDLVQRPDPGAGRRLAGSTPRITTARSCMYRALARRTRGTRPCSSSVPGRTAAGHGADGESLGPIRFGAKTERALPDEQVELPFFNLHLKDKGPLDAAERDGLRNRAQPLASRTTRWPPKEAGEDGSTCGANGRSRSRRPGAASGGPSTPT